MGTPARVVSRTTKIRLDRLTCIVRPAELENEESGAKTNVGRYDPINGRFHRKSGGDDDLVIILNYGNVRPLCVRSEVSTECLQLLY